MKPASLRRILIACLAAPATLFAQSAGTGLRPGLWEMQIVKQIVDGRDVSAQVAAATQQMQQTMAHMPPAERARMQAMLGGHGMSAGAHGYRICVTPQMAKRRSPILDKEGHCQKSKMTHSGNRTTFAFTCTENGSTTTGTGVSTITEDLVTTRTRTTTVSSSGEKHTMQMESKMRYLSPDCGNVKPPAGE